MGATEEEAGVAEQPIVLRVTYAGLVTPSGGALMGWPEALALDGAIGNDDDAGKQQRRYFGSVPGQTMGFGDTARDVRVWGR